MVQIKKKMFIFHESFPANESHRLTAKLGVGILFIPKTLGMAFFEGIVSMKKQLNF